MTDKLRAGSVWVDRKSVYDGRRRVIEVTSPGSSIPAVGSRVGGYSVWQRQEGNGSWLDEGPSFRRWTSKLRTVFLRDFDCIKEAE